MDNIDTPTTDLVVLDAENILIDPDTEGTSNAAVGAICLAAGVALGAFVVPPVVGFVKNLFSKPKTEEVVEQVETILETTKDKATKAS